MSKFKNSKESVSSDLYLWNDRPTQVAIRDTYSMKIWPITNIFNDGPINFKVPEQTKGMLRDLEIVTKLKIRKNGQDLEHPERGVSVVNNFSNSIWDKVEITIDDRVDITQNMRNVYPYKTLFNHAINFTSNREDYLLYNEMFKMDQGRTKQLEEESRTFWKWNQELDETFKDMIPETKNKDDTLELVKELILKFNHQITGQSLMAVAIGLGGATDDDTQEKNNTSD